MVLHHANMQQFEFSPQNNVFLFSIRENVLSKIPISVNKPPKDGNSQKVKGVIICKNKRHIKLVNLIYFGKWSCGRGNNR